MVEFGGSGEAKQCAQHIPTSHDTQEGEQDTKSVTTISSEPDPALTDASLDAENIPTCHDTPEGEQDAASVTTIGSEPEPGLMEADQKVAAICLEVQNRPKDKIMAWIQGVRDATNA